MPPPGMVLVSVLVLVMIIGFCCMFGMVFAAENQKSGSKGGEVTEED